MLLEGLDGRTPDCCLQWLSGARRPDAPGKREREREREEFGRPPNGSKHRQTSKCTCDSLVLLAKEYDRSVSSNVSRQTLWRATPAAGEG